MRAICIVVHARPPFALLGESSRLRVVAQLLARHLVVETAECRRLALMESSEVSQGLALALTVVGKVEEETVQWADF